MELYLKKQLLIVSCLYIGQITCGYGIGWTSNAVVKLQDPEQTQFPEPITETQGSWLGSLAYVGLVCSPAAGYLANAKGRKICFIFGGIIYTGTHLMLALATNLATAYAARILVGLALGFIHVINLVYIAEIASTNIRGALLAGTGVFHALGILLGYVIGPYISYAGTGYVGFALTAVFSAGSFLLPESPVYHILKGQEKEATEVLIALGRKADIKDLLDNKLNEPRETITQAQAWREIFTVKSNRKAMIITGTLMILQQLSGAMAVLFFATSIFNLTGSSLEPHVSTMIIGATQLVAVCITPFVIERLGRRLLMLVSTTSCCICLALLGIYFFLADTNHPAAEQIQWLPIVSLMIFISSYNFGFGIIPGTLTGEMFDSNVRGPGSVFIFSLGWLLGFAGVTTFAYMLSGIGTYFTFWFYSVVCGLATIFTAIFLPETKGKSLIEIQEMLSK